MERLSLRVRIYLILLVTILILITTSSFYIYIVLNKIIYQQIHRSIDSEIYHTQSEILSFWKSIYQAENTTLFPVKVQALQTLDEAVLRLEEDFDTNWGIFISEKPFLGGFFLLADKDGFLIYSPVKPLKKSNLYKFSWGRQIMINKEGFKIIFYRWEPWVISWKRLKNGYTLIYVIPPSELKNLYGYDEIVTALKGFENRIQKLTFGKGGVIFIQDEEGFIFPKTIDKKLIEKLKSKSSTLKIEQTGLVFNWKVYALIDTKSLIMPLLIKLIRAFIISGIITTILGSLIISYYIRQKLIKPLDALKGGFKELQANNLSYRIKADSKETEKEILDLYTSFNETTKKLNEQSIEIENKSMMLESAYQELKASKDELAATYQQIQAYAHELEEINIQLNNLRKINEKIIRLLHESPQDMLTKILKEACELFKLDLCLLDSKGQILWSSKPITKDQLNTIVPLAYKEKIYAYMGSTTPIDQARWLKILANDLAIALAQAESIQREKDLALGIASSLATAVELIDPYTKGHSERVKVFSCVLTKELNKLYNLELIPIRKMEFAAVLHDVGKIGVPTNILKKPAKLTKEEFEYIKKHPVEGAKIVGQIPGFEDIALWIKHHHERYDGKGYPDGLKGESIPLASRIIAIADAFDAITSNRPYSPARSTEEAIKELQKNAGTQFDPKLVEIFIKYIQRKKDMDKT